MMDSDGRNLNRRNFVRDVARKQFISR